MKLPARLVAVHWTDAFDSDNGWIDVKEYKPKPCCVVSVGFLWEDCLDGHISLTASWFPEDEDEHRASTVGMVTHIPKGMVNQIVDVFLPSFAPGLASQPTAQSQPNQTTPLSPALDYPPYAASTPRAASPLRGRRPR